MSIELRCGRWQDVLADVECDALITDPPYSARTHAGQRTGSSLRVPTITYDCMTEDGAHELARSWAPRTRWWAFICCDHSAFNWHEAAWSEAGWLVFAPVFLKSNPPPRFSGDGPTLSLEFVCAARRRTSLRKSGSLPGVYETTWGLSCNRASGIAGAKPLALMRSVVSDYTQAGDLVADCCAGSGTTLLAARLEGRRAIGAEVDPDTYAKAKRRIEQGDHAARHPEQGALFPAAEPESR